MDSGTGRFSLGIRGRLTLWFALGAVGVLLFGAAVVYTTGMASIQGTLGQTYCQIASRVAGQFENHFTQKTSLIRNIAIDVLTAETVMETNSLYRNRPEEWIKTRLGRLSGEWSAKDGRARMALLHPQLSQRLSILAGLESGLVRSLSVYDIRGVLLGSTASNIPRVAAESAWYRSVIKEDEHFTYLDLYKPGDVLKTVVPVWGGVEIAGFVYAELDYTFFSRDIMSIRFGQSGEALAVDYAGVPLQGEARSFLIAALSGKNPDGIVSSGGDLTGSEPYWVALSGHGDGGLWERLVCVAPLASLNAIRDKFRLPSWMVVVTQSPDESYAALRKSLGSFAVAGGFGVILIGFAGAFAAWTLTQPLQDLRKGVRRFAVGQRDHPVKVSGTDEIGELAEEFNKMAKRVSESENELRAFAQAVEDAADAIILTDPKGVIYYTNPAFEQTTGYSPEEAKGNRPSMLSSSNTPEEIYQNMWDAVSEGLSWRGELWNKRKSGEIYPVDLTISPIHGESGETVSLLGIHRDITLAHEYQERLENEVESRTKEISETRSLTVLGRMASMIAHDLRNALSTVKMNLQILHRKHKTTEGVELEHCQMGLDQVRYMEEFLSDMLSYASPERLRSDWHNIEKAVDEALASVSHIIDEHGIKVSPDIDKGLPMVYCDRFKILAVLRNLIENAIYAMQENGELTIRAKLMMSSPAPMVQVEVSDTGSGIADDIKDDVMEPFFTTRAKGTGLGLAIVKSIIEQHGGEIALVSELGHGTTVSFTLPTEPESF